MRKSLQLLIASLLIIQAFQLPGVYAQDDDYDSDEPAGDSGGPERQSVDDLDDSVEWAREPENDLSAMYAGKPDVGDSEFHTVGTQECSAIPERIDRVFRIGDRIVFYNSNDTLTKNGTYVWEVKIGSVGSVARIRDISKIAGTSINNIYTAVHIEQEKACSNVASNPRFCRISKLYNNNIFWFGYDVKKVKNETKRRLQSDFYDKVEGMAVPSFSFIADDFSGGNSTGPANAPTPQIHLAKQAPIGGSTEKKVHQIFTTFFINFVHNGYIRFRGISYDSNDDALYTVGSINTTSVDSKAWTVGTHVMFRANFSPHGLILDSYRAATFDEDKLGIFSYNGLQYVLSNDGTSFSVYNKGTITKKALNLTEMFCSMDSPLNEARIDRTFGERTSGFNEQNIIPNVAQYLIPHLPDFIKIVDSQSLDGWTFIMLIIFLAIAFVLMCLINVFTVLEDIKLDRKLRKRRRRSRGSRSRSRSGSPVRSVDGRSIASASSQSAPPKGGFSSMFNTSGIGLPSLRKRESESSSDRTDKLPEPSASQTGNLAQKSVTASETTKQ